MQSLGKYRRVDEKRVATKAVTFLKKRSVASRKETTERFFLYCIKKNRIQPKQ
ncbi:hypothetical protein B4119_3250 [Parageobacillus caldoxylosilyticus]|uniref:Uncharacterized protein n=1 Tax=Saccharococcus caldoxylosilyticus TaxID=81408 RepID=A0A150M5C6_9BACL|nr:hypothetical protein B4119_3250 [Parageobacillus caldoxylosilyticus]